MKNTCPFYTVFKILKVLFKKMYLRYSRQLFCLFLIFFILISKNKLAFTISRSFFINFKEFHSTLFLFVTNYLFLITCLSPPFGYSRKKPEEEWGGGQGLMTYFKQKTHEIFRFLILTLEIPAKTKIHP